MKLYVANRVKGNHLFFGCSLVDKNGRIVFHDCLKVAESKGTSKNSIECLQWALKRVRSQFDTKALELDSESLKVFITNKNLMKWLTLGKSPKAHILEYHQLDLQLALYPYELEVLVSKEPFNLVGYEPVSELDGVKKDKQNSMKAFLQSL